MATPPDEAGDRARAPAAAARSAASRAVRCRDHPQIPRGDRGRPGRRRSAGVLGNLRRAVGVAGDAPGLAFVLRCGRRGSDAAGLRGRVVPGRAHFLEAVRPVPLDGLDRAARGCLATATPRSATARALRPGYRRGAVEAASSAHGKANGSGVPVPSRPRRRLPAIAMRRCSGGGDIGPTGRREATPSRRGSAG